MGMTDPFLLEGGEPIDMLVILDSCYSCGATRAQPAERVFEMVAAVKSERYCVEKTRSVTSLSALNLPITSSGTKNMY